jgi:hypothetical protein
MMPAHSGDSDMRPDITHPLTELPYQLRRAEASPDRWQVVLGADADAGDPQIGGW